MIILPAIDIQNGECVRLRKGDFSTSEVVAQSYMETAKSFEIAGARWIHMVDLDGAVKKKPIHQDIFIDVAKNTGLNVEVGGGIRTLDNVEMYLSKGIKRVILGSVALKNPLIVKQAVMEYGDRIAVGIDSLNGKVAAEGWLDSSSVNYTSLAKEMSNVGVKCIIFTDISKDGTLSGPNLEQLKEISNAVPDCNIIASGGIQGENDIIDCKKLNLYGAICGKSLYKGTLDIVSAIRIAGDQNAC